MDTQWLHAACSERSFSAGLSAVGYVEWMEVSVLWRVLKGNAVSRFPHGTHLIMA